MDYENEGDVITKEGDFFSENFSAWTESEYEFSLTVSNGSLIDFYIISNGSIHQKEQSEFRKYIDNEQFNSSSEAEGISKLDNFSWKGKRYENFTWVIDNKDNGNANDTIPQGNVTVYLKVTNLNTKASRDLSFLFTKLFFGIISISFAITFVIKPIIRWIRTK